MRDLPGQRGEGAPQRAPPSTTPLVAGASLVGPGMAGYVVSKKANVPNGGPTPLVRAASSSQPETP